MRTLAFVNYVDGPGGVMLIATSCTAKGKPDFTNMWNPKSKPNRRQTQRYREPIGTSRGEGCLGGSREEGGSRNTNPVCAWGCNSPRGGHGHIVSAWCGDTQ